MLVVFVLLYGGIVYGFSSYSYVFLSVTRGYSAGFVFALTAWAGLVAAAFYAINAYFGDKVERRYMVLFGAILFAGSWFGLYNVHNTTGVVILYIAVLTGEVIFLWNMYAYVPLNFPTRFRGLGTGWTDGVGHLGAWGGVLIAGALFNVTAPLGFFLFITIPCALLPGLLLAIFGKRQRDQALEELAQ
jgi:putative MFS transporter